MQNQKVEDLIFSYFCSSRNSKMVDELLKQNMGRANDERYVFHQIHQKLVEKEGADETEFYESLEKELLGLMAKYEKVLNEDTKMKAMNICIEARLQCVLCKLRGKKIDFKVFKNGIDKFFPDVEQTTLEYPGVEEFLATVTYTKTRDTLIKCISHGKGNDFIVKYVKSFFNDAFYVDTFKKKVIDLLTNIESDAKGTPGLMSMIGELNDADTKGLVLTSIASIVAKGHGSPIVVAPPLSGTKRKTLSTSSSTNSSKKTKKQKTSKKKKKSAPLEESTSSQTTTQDEDVEEPVIEQSPPLRRSARKAKKKKKSQDEKENAPQSTSSRRSVKKRKAIAHKEESGSYSLSRFFSNLSFLHTHTHTLQWSKNSRKPERKLPKTIRSILSFLPVESTKAEVRNLSGLKHLYPKHLMEKMRKLKTMDEEKGRHQRNEERRNLKPRK